MTFAVGREIKIALAVAFGLILTSICMAVLGVKMPEQWNPIHLVTGQREIIATNACVENTSEKQVYFVSCGGFF